MDVQIHNFEIVSVIFSYTRNNIINTLFGLARVELQLRAAVL
jgi:hypothetical protein